jgi:hypothetical protein
LREDPLSFDRGDEGGGVSWYRISRPAAAGLAMNGSSIRGFAICGGESTVGDARLSTKVVKCPGVATCQSGVGCEGAPETIRSLRSNGDTRPSSWAERSDDGDGERLRGERVRGDPKDCMRSPRLVEGRRPGVRAPEAGEGVKRRRASILRRLGRVESLRVEDTKWSLGVWTSL